MSGAQERRNKIVFLLVLWGFLSPAVSFAAERAGFSRGSVWYSYYPVVEYKTVRIYGSVFNSSGYDLSGSVQFLIDDGILGETPLSVPAGVSRDVWIDWAPVVGTHTVSARVVGVRGSKPGAPEALREIEFPVSGDDQIVVDADFDRDGVGDQADLDDDNDGIADLLEIEEGSNPHDPTSPSRRGEPISGSDVANEKNTQIASLKEAVIPYLPVSVVPAITPVLDSVDDAVMSVDRSIVEPTRTTLLGVVSKQLEARSESSGITPDVASLRVHITQSPLQTLLVAGLWGARIILSSRTWSIIFFIIFMYYVLRVIGALLFRS